jgi:hypothetical protein
VKGLNALLRLLGLFALGVAGYLGYLYVSSDRFHGALAGAGFFAPDGARPVVVLVDAFGVGPARFYNVASVGLDAGARIGRTKWVGEPEVRGAAGGQLWVADGLHELRGFEPLGADPVAAAAPPALSTAGEPCRAAFDALPPVTLVDSIGCARIRLVDGSGFVFDRGQIWRLLPGGRSAWAVPRFALTGEDRARPVAAHLYGDLLVLVLQADGAPGAERAWAVAALDVAHGEIRWKY